MQYKRMRCILLVTAVQFTTVADCQSFAPMDSLVRKNEVALDMTGFIRQFVPTGQDPLLTTYYTPQYLFAYKRAWGRGAFRSGIGGDYSLLTDTGGYSSNSNYTNYSWTVDLRIGKEWRYALSNRWTWYAGFDLIGGIGKGVQHNLSTQHGRPDWKSNRFAVGTGPVMGIQFHLGRRISMYTEASLYWVYQEVNEQYDYPESDEHDRKGLRVNADIAFRYPIAVWFAIAL